MKVLAEAKKAYAKGDSGWARYDDEFVQRSIQANGDCWIACECGVWLSIPLTKTVYCCRCDREYHHNPGGLYRHLRRDEDPPLDNSQDVHGLGRLWLYYQSVAPPEQAMALLRMHLERD